MSSVVGLPFAVLRGEPFVAPPPPTATYAETMAALEPDGYWRLNDTSPTVFADSVGGNDGAWTGVLRTFLPQITEADGAASVGLKGGFGTIPSLTLSASFTVDIALQLDRVPPVKFLVLTTGGGTTPGEFSLEIVPDGEGGARVRVWSVPTSGSLVSWLSPADSVPVGRPFKLSIVRDASTGGLGIVINGALSSKTVESGTSPTSWPAAPPRTWRLGQWTTPGVAPYEGLMAELAVWDRAVDVIDLAALVLLRQAAFLADFSAASVQASQSTEISLLAAAHPVTTALPQIVVPPSLGSAEVAGNTIDYTAGATPGVDELRARITAGSVVSRTARIGIEVSAAPSGGGGWVNGWQELTTSPRGWLPDPLTSSAFSVNYRSWSSPPGYINFGLTNKAGRNGVMYRQMDEGMPVFNSNRSVNVGFPSGTMAVHLEWWGFYDSNARLAIGKRFGFHDVGGAGGSQIAGVTDTTTSGLGLPGGWSVRWSPAGSSSSSVLVPQFYTWYSYMQNRRALGRTNVNGVLPGLTTFSNSGFPLNQWVKFNWTIVLNSPYQANGIMRMWVNGTLRLSLDGILWQEEIDNHPFHRFWWSWMWGGVAENVPPVGTWREHFGDFRLAIASRANAIASPWPFGGG